MNEIYLCVSLHPSLPFEGKTGITDNFIVTLFIAIVKSITLEAHEREVVLVHH
jgi:hypothetical protein